MEVDVGRDAESFVALDLLAGRESGSQLPLAAVGTRREIRNPRLQASNVEAAIHANSSATTSSPLSAWQLRRQRTRNSRQHECHIMPGRRSGRAAAKRAAEKLGMSSASTPINQLSITHHLPLHQRHCVFACKCITCANRCIHLQRAHRVPSKRWKTRQCATSMATAPMSNDHQREMNKMATPSWSPRRRKRTRNPKPPRSSRLRLRLSPLFGADD